MHLLGVHLPDAKLVKIALLSFYGIGLPTAERLCARLQIHDRCLVSQLTDAQTAALSAFLSAPSTTPPPPSTPRAKLLTKPVPVTEPAPPLVRSMNEDLLGKIKLETELRRQMRANIAHHREIGTYVGRRHAMHLPVRGQNTNSNAKTARKLNRVERRAMSTSASSIVPGCDRLPSSIFTALRDAFRTRRPS